MKQITRKQAEKLAKTDKHGWRRTWEAEAAEWIRNNASAIACATRFGAPPFDRERCGEWPKGWRRAMNEAADSAAIDRWVSDHCREIDGVLWCYDWQVIQALEGGSA